MMLCGQHGLWKRAGLDGIVCGFDRATALQCAPAGADRELLVHLLHAVEAGYLTGLAEKTKENTRG